MRKLFWDKESANNKPLGCELRIFPVSSGLPIYVCWYVRAIKRVTFIEIYKYWLIFTHLNTARGFCVLDIIFSTFPGNADSCFNFIFPFLL